VTPLALNSLFPYFIAETPKASERAEVENFNPWLLFPTLSPLRRWKKSSTRAPFLHFVGGK